MDYKTSGVDIEAGYKSVELMKKHIAKTMRPEVLGGIGGFSGAFSMEKFKDMEEPTLVSGTDGCGTKVKVAMVMDKHDTIGIDAVAMCVNDIACAGGEPLFFLDYIACGKNYPEKIAEIVKGVAEGCVQTSLCIDLSLFSSSGVVERDLYIVMSVHSPLQRLLRSLRSFPDNFCRRQCSPGKTMARHLHTQYHLRTWLRHQFLWYHACP